ncbi:hypothetical protein HDU93_009172 [Gonapodya sp. JEL0774]|nr:hypothetical protein HDU93_009172 [Gonapodya sp. JEL0774]
MNGSACKGYGPDYVRLTYHDGGTYSVVDGSGGARGTLKIVPFLNGTLGLLPGIQSLEIIKERYPAISYADLWAFAGAVAVYERSLMLMFPDSVGEYTDAQNHGRLPQGWNNATVIRQSFGRMGFTDRETVALIGGGHSMGRTTLFGAFGLTAPATFTIPELLSRETRKLSFTNQFFVLRTQDSTSFRPVANPNGLTQFNITDNSKMALPSDHSLTLDQSYAPITQEYAKNASIFFSDFAAAYSKLMELGSSLVDANAVNVTGVSGTRLGVATDAQSSTAFAGGWSSVQLGSMLLLKWKLRQSDGYIDFQLFSMAGGWFAFGIGSGMPSQDVYSYEPATGKITDRISSTFDMPTPDTEANGLDNVENFQDLTASLGQGTWTKVVGFSRKLNTGDLNDAIIAPGSMTITYAWSTDSPSIAYHGANKGKISLDMFTAVLIATSTDSKVLALQAFHGITMLVSFGLLLPLGIFFAKYSDLYPLVWLQQHEKINTLVYTNVALSALIALVGRLSGGNETTHPILGMILFGTLTITVLVGFLIGHYLNIPSNLSRHLSRGHKYIKLFHVVSGYSCYILGLTNGALGLWDYMTRSISTRMADQIIALSLYVSAVMAVPTALYFYHARQKRKLLLERDDKGSYSGEEVGKTGSTIDRQLSKLVEVTWDDFNRQVLEGKKYIVIKDIVYDIGNWMQRHPGGKMILNSVIGTDCTDYFNGAETPGALVGGHSHSRVAQFQKEEYGSLSSDHFADEGTQRQLVVSFDDLEYFIIHLGNAVFRLMTISERRLLSKPLASTKTYAYTFKFTNPNDVIHFQPGDHVSIRIRNGEGRLIERAYTPLRYVAMGYFTCVIRIRPNGGFTPILEQMGPGDIVRVKAMREVSSQNPPVTNPLDPTLCFHKLGLLSSGVGIAPMIQLLDYYTNAGRRRRDGSYAFTIYLTAVFSTEQDVVCREVVEKYAAQLGQAFHYRFVIRKRADPTAPFQGIVAKEITVDLLKDNLPPPPKVTDTAMRVLDQRAMGADDHRTFVQPEVDVDAEVDDLESPVEESTRIIISGNQMGNDRFLELLGQLDFRNCVILLP